jgi:CRP/FNR family cyclic AMP-dependent transcriptional regulator
MKLPPIQREKAPLPRARARPKASRFGLKNFLDQAVLRTKTASFQTKQTVFAQGNPAQNVMFIQEGRVRLSVVSKSGKQAVLGVLGPGDFFGEGCLSGQPIYTATAIALGPTSILMIGKDEMIRLLHENHEFSDRFIAYILARNIRVEEDLIDQLFNSSEKRLARTLLLLARTGLPTRQHGTIPTPSQETLAETIGTTRSRVNFFMRKFRKLGFIDYNRDEIRVKSSLLNVIVRD